MTNDLAFVRRVWLTKMCLCCCAGDDANVLVDLLKVTTLLLTTRALKALPLHCQASEELLEDRALLMLGPVLAIAPPTQTSM